MAFFLAAALPAAARAAVSVSSVTGLVDRPARTPSQRRPVRVTAFLGRRPAASFAPTSTAVPRPFQQPLVPAPRIAAEWDSPSPHGALDALTEDAISLKQQLKDLIGRASVSEMRTELFRARAEELTSRLASQNPCAAPSTSVHLRGTWRLLYTTETPLDGIMENGFPPFYRSGCILQEVQGENRGQITNIIELVKDPNATPAPGSDDVDARFLVFVDYEVESKKRIRFQFKRTSVRAGTSFRLDLPFAFGSGWLETTYLDESFRVQVDSRGWLSVFEKVH